jgi:predicted NBD/HSP70 family sugar kinase
MGLAGAAFRHERARAPSLNRGFARESFRGADVTRIGVDIGGTKTELIALGNDGRVIARRREPTPRGGYGESLETLAALVLDLEREVAERCTVGIGTPGRVSRETGLLSNAYALVFNERPIKRDLESLLGREVRFANDANCFALSEASDGAAKDAKVVFGVILGTGVGGGIVVDGKVLEGANAIAGEWGHNPLPWPDDDERPGPQCGCGRLGCIEAFLSGPGLARDHERESGESLSPEAIVEGAKAGAPSCLSSLARYETRLGKALAHIMNVIDPEAIVLGGGLSGVQSLYRNVPERWKGYVYAGSVITRLARAMHGDASGVRGGAWLWPAG